MFEHPPRNPTSPQARRPRVREMVPTPPAPGRDMTATELTHAVQHLMNQGQSDIHWFANMRGVIDNHAVRIDNVADALFTQEEDASTLTTQLRSVLAQVESNDLTTKATLERNDAHTKAVIEAQLVTTNAKMQELNVSFDTMRAMMAALEGNLNAVDSFVREQGGRFAQELRHMGDKLSATGACAAAATAAAAGQPCPQASQVPNSRFAAASNEGFPAGFPCGGAQLPTAAPGFQQGGQATPQAFYPGTTAASPQEVNRGYFAGCAAGAPNTHQAPGFNPHHGQPTDFGRRDDGPQQSGYGPAFFNMARGDGNGQPHEQTAMRGPMFEEKVASNPSYIYTIILSRRLRLKRYVIT